MQGFLDTCFFDILFVFLDSSGTLLFDVFIYFAGFPGTFLIFCFSLWFSIVSTFFIYQLHHRVFLKPCFLICKFRCLIFHTIFILIYGFFVIFISPFHCLCSLFLIIIIFCFFRIQISLSLWRQSLLPQ